MTNGTQAIQVVKKKTTKTVKVGENVNHLVINIQGLDYNIDIDLDSVREEYKEISQTDEDGKMDFVQDKESQNLTKSSCSDDISNNHHLEEKEWKVIDLLTPELSSSIESVWYDTVSLKGTSFSHKSKKSKGGYSILKNKYISIYYKKGSHPTINTGFDWGTNTFLTGSNGELIQINHNDARGDQEGLNNSLKHLSIILSRIYESGIAFENLVNKSDYNKILSDTVWNQAKPKNKKKLEQHRFYESRYAFVYLLDELTNSGNLVLYVDTKNTSRVCSECGNTQNYNLTVDEFKCKMCDAVIQRDVNAARNIEQRAFS